jgi:hypothetical protein
MRPRALIEVGEKLPSASPSAPVRARDTYEHVRRTLDDALAELELPPNADRDRSAPHIN